MLEERRHGRNIFSNRWEEVGVQESSDNRINHLRALSSALRGISKGNLLEIGCGSGYSSNGIAERKPGSIVLALDFTSSALEIARSSHVIPIQADAFELPFKDGSIQASWHEGIIEHYPTSWRGLLEEQYRVTAEAGLLITSVPNILNLPRTIAYEMQGERFRYYPARGFLPGKFGALYQEYKRLGLEISEMYGWGMTYPAKNMYEWDETTQTKRYPTYIKLIHAAGKLLDRPLAALDTLLQGDLSKLVGFEFMLVGKK